MYMRSPWPIIVLIICSVVSAEEPKPVTPNASSEASALLTYLYSISGNYTLTGQHTAPQQALKRMEETQATLGVMPAVFSQEFGYARRDEWDGHNFRQRLVDEAIRRHGEGFVIALMWHAVRPIEDEPVQFKESVQGGLTPAEWTDLLTPGTAINERWKSQVDVIAFFLKQLRDANIPVLWRPYHEMNGRWFWWGRTPDPEFFKKLYRMMFDRFVNYHKLNNLVWVYGANEHRLVTVSYERCYPGADVVDVLGTDVYTGGYAQRDYEELLALANGKPIGIFECGTPPSVEVLKAQPKWTTFILWDPPKPDTPKESYTCEQALTLNRLPWVKK